MAYLKCGANVATTRYFGGPRPRHHQEPHAAGKGPHDRVDRVHERPVRRSGENESLPSFPPGGGLALPVSVASRAPLALYEPL
jgi:hypothetical protein